MVWLHFALLPTIWAWIAYMTLGLTFWFLDNWQPAWYTRRALDFTGTGRADIETFDLGATIYRVTRNMAICLVVAGVFWSAWFRSTLDVNITPLHFHPASDSLKMLASLVMADVWFYYSHRLFHASSWLYTHIHKHHHVFVKPFALVALDCHPVEMVLVNLPTLLVGPALTDLSASGLVLFVVGATWFTQLEHCGHKLTSIFGDATHHDLHHRLVKGNYGLTQTLDRLHGTLI